MKVTPLSKFLVNKSIRAETLPDFESMEVLGVSNKFGITVTDHKKSADLAKYLLIEEGDFAYNPYRINVGSIGLVPNHTRGLVSPAYVVFSTTDELHPVLLLDFLKSQEGLHQISKYARGTVRKALRFEDLCQIEMPIPSVEKQIKILEKRKGIEVEVDDLKSELTRQQTLLKKLRQQILQEAIEGKLTADWRAANPDVEPASELLKRIADEKAQLIKDKKIKSQKLLPPIKDEEKPFDLPMGWVWCRLSHIIYEDPRNGYSPKAVDYVTETKTLKLGATTKGYFDSTEYKYINEMIDDDSYLWLENGDILIQRSNSLDHVGISAIYDGGFHEFIYPDIMMKIKVVGLIPTPFVFNVLSSKLCRKYFRKNATGAQKSMPKINQGIVSKALITLPPLDEQREIIKKIKDIFALCGQLETQINQNKSYAEQLMQAVLKEAFQPITN